MSTFPTKRLYDLLYQDLTELQRREKFFEIVATTSLKRVLVESEIQIQCAGKVMSESIIQGLIPERFLPFLQQLDVEIPQETPRILGTEKKEQEFPMQEFPTQEIQDPFEDDNVETSFPGSLLYQLNQGLHLRNVVEVDNKDGDIALQIDHTIADLLHETEYTWFEMLELLTKNGYETTQEDVIIDELAKCGYDEIELEDGMLIFRSQ